MLERIDTLGSAATETRKKFQSCQVPGCSADLCTQQKAAYCIKRRLCRQHMQADAVQRVGFGSQLWHFCFQCGKLQPISCFEGQQRSCKSSLKHRRRAAASCRRQSSDNSDSSAGGYHHQRCHSLPCPISHGNSSFNSTSVTSVICGAAKPRRRSFAELEAEICRRSSHQQQQQLTSCFATEHIQALDSTSRGMEQGAQGPWLSSLDQQRSLSTTLLSNDISAHVLPADVPAAADAIRLALQQRQLNVTQAMPQLQAASSGELNNSSSHEASSNKACSTAGAVFCAVTAAAELANAFCGTFEAINTAAANADGCCAAVKPVTSTDVEADHQLGDRVLQQLLYDMEACAQLQEQQAGSSRTAAFSTAQVTAAGVPAVEATMSEAELMALIEQELLAATTAAWAFGVGSSCAELAAANNNQQQQPWLVPASVSAPLPTVSALQPAAALQPASPAERPEVELLEEPCLEILRARLDFLQIKSLQLQQLLISSQAVHTGPVGIVKMGSYGGVLPHGYPRGA